MICNYCTISKLAASLEKGQKLTMHPHPLPGFPRGISVFIHPENTSVNKDKHFIAWFAMLSDKCICAELKQAMKN